jgi:hypothetical protein
MLMAESTIPDVVLQPFIHWYVQRETLSNDKEIVEPVFPRAGQNCFVLPGQRQSSGRSIHARCG